MVYPATENQTLDTKINTSVTRSSVPGILLTALTVSILNILFFSILLLNWPEFFNILAKVYKPFLSIPPLNINDPRFIETGYYYDFKAKITNLEISQKRIAISTDFPLFVGQMLTLSPTAKFGVEKGEVIVTSGFSTVNELRKGNNVGIRMSYNPRNGQWLLTQLVLLKTKD